MTTTNNNTATTTLNNCYGGGMDARTLPYVRATNKVAITWLLKKGYVLAKGVKSTTDYDYNGSWGVIASRDVYYVLNWDMSNKAFGRMLKAHGLRLEDQKGGSK